MTETLVLLLPIAAVVLDRCIGDPHRLPHPVQAIGALISGLRPGLESLAGDHPIRLRLAGLALCLGVVGCSAGAGQLLELLSTWSWRQGGLAALIGSIPLLLGLGSCLAGRSLRLAVEAVLALLPTAETTSAQTASAQDVADGRRDLDPARRRLAWIVGRDCEALSSQEILRALAETASENAVDGLFAPLFWILVGTTLWLLHPPSGSGAASATLPLGTPGPLCLGWMFKAASTLDSMVGYRRGRLRWLGTAGARLDDLLTWIPCRLVVLSLPIAAGRPWFSQTCWLQALREGRPDPSPNAGVSQAAYALVTGVRLGGPNRYGGVLRDKPVLAGWLPAPKLPEVLEMLDLTDRLEGLWLLLWMLLAGGLAMQTTTG